MGSKAVESIAAFVAKLFLDNDLKNLEFCPGAANIGQFKITYPVCTLFAFQGVRTVWSGCG